MEYKEKVPSRFPSAIFGTVVCLCSIATLSAQSLKLPEGPGKATVEKVCGECHGAEIVIGRQEDKEAWSAIVEDMVQRGAEGTDEQMSQIVDYLSKNFSKSSPAVKINVNKATAKDLETSLRITDKQAAAIVQQREQKGAFKSIEELEKVPGVDAAKIEASKNRLAF